MVAAGAVPVRGGTALYQYDVGWNMKCDFGLRVTFVGRTTLGSSGRGGVSAFALAVDVDLSATGWDDFVAGDFLFFSDFPALGPTVLAVLLGVSLAFSLDLWSGVFGLSDRSCKNRETSDVNVGYKRVISTSIST